MAKKKLEEEEEEEDSEEEEEDDDFEEGSFTCRLCKKTTTLGEGDDLILVCDDCVDKNELNIDKIWEDYDHEKILEEKLASFDLEPYMKKNAAKKATAKKTVKK